MEDRLDPGALAAAMAALAADFDAAMPGRIAGLRRSVALARTGALAVDMESAWLAPAAAGRPFAVVRVVLDTPAHEICRSLATLAGGLAAWRALRRAAPALALWARA